MGGKDHAPDRDAPAMGRRRGAPRRGAPSVSSSAGAVKRLHPARPLLVAVPLTVVLLGGSPASATHATLQVEWRSPGTDPEAGVVVDGAVTVEADVSFDSGVGTSNVAEWQVQLETDDGDGLGVLCTRAYPDAGTATATVDFAWDSRFVPSGTVNTECLEGESANVDTTRRLENGRYVFRLRAHDQVLTDEWHEQVFDIGVNNRPRAPEGVSASFDEGAQQVDVAWTANPEPDLSGYRVQQCRTDSASEECTASHWTTVAENGAADTDAVIGVTEAGAYRFRVLARRPNWSQTSTLSSDPTRAGSSIVLERDDSGDADDGTDGNGSTSDPDDSGADDVPTTVSDDPADSDQGSESDGGVVERRRSLGPRLIQREIIDAGFDQALPYERRPVDETSSRSDGLLAGEEGAGLALVPIAGGLVALVLAFQIRYLGRRASPTVANGGDAGGADEYGGDVASGDEDGDRPTFRPLLGGSSGPGSFISNWRRWIPKG